MIQPKSLGFRREQSNGIGPTLAHGSNGIWTGENDEFFGPSGISVGGNSAFSYSASRYSYSKSPEAIQVDHLFRDTTPPVFGPFFNEIPTLPFEYEYRFTEYENEYEKYRRYELPATIIPDGPIFFASQPLAPCFYRRLERLNHSLR